MFNRTQPKQLAAREGRPHSSPFDKLATATLAHSSPTPTAAAGGRQQSKRGSSSSVGLLPPIQPNAATGAGLAVTANNSSAANMSTTATSSPRRQSPHAAGAPRPSFVELTAFPSVAAPRAGSAASQRSSVSGATATAAGEGDVSSFGRAPGPARPPSAGRAAGRPRRSPAESSPKRGRQSSVGSIGGASARLARPPSFRSPHRQRLKSLKMQVDSDELAMEQLMLAGNTGGALTLLSRTLEGVQEFQTVANPPTRRRGSVAASATPAHTAAAVAAQGGLPAAAAAWAAETVQRLAEVFTTIANNAGVRSSTGAEPMAVQEAYFQAAMRYLVKGPTEELFAEWTKEGNAGAISSPRSRHAASPLRPRSPPNNAPRRPMQRPTTRSTAAPAAGATTTATASAHPPCFRASRDSKSGVADTTSAPVVLRRLLRCAVRVNAAVCLVDGATPGGQARMAYELLKALSESDGVWAATALYNLAVGFLRIGSYDDAAEAIARCMELGWYYLAWAETVEEAEAATETEGPLASVAAAVRAHTALQLVRGHHFIAAMAAWCEPQGTIDLYHCELACACAARHLSPADATQAECHRRLAAAQARAVAAPRAHGAKRGAAADADAAAVPPLLLPYVTQDLVLTCPASATAGAAGSAPATVTMHALVDALVATSAGAAALPADVRAYLREVQRGTCVRRWARTALSVGATPPFLSAAVAAAADAPVPSVLLVLLAHGEEGEGVWAGHASHWATSALAQPPDDGLAPEEDVATPLKRLLTAASTAGASRASVLALSSPRRAPPGTTVSPTASREPSASPGAETSPCKPSKPAPLFVTTIPGSAYDRYRRLRDGVVARFEKAELVEDSAVAATTIAPDHGAALQLSAAAGDVDDLAVRPSSNSTRSVTSSISIAADAAHVRQRRVTALFLGASAGAAAATTAGASSARSGRFVAVPSSLSPTVVGASADVGAATPPAVLDTSMLAVPVRPSELLRQLDEETEARYSRLIADPLADVHRIAATRLQAWWRTQRAGAVRRQRAAAVTTDLRREAAAFCMQCAFRNWHVRQPARAELHRRRANRERVRCTTVVQAFLQQRASVEVWGRACVVWYKALVVMREEERRRAAAAVTLQSWWRMHAARLKLRAAVAAVVTLQCAWRRTMAQRELRARRVHRRLAQEKWRLDRLPQIIYVQRWWRASCAFRAVGDLLQRKQRAVQTYLSSAEEAYETAMRTHLRDTDGVEAAMRCVLAVLAGARDRRRLAALAVHAAVRRRAVHAYALRCRGLEQLRQLRRERTAALALQRRREEVAVATLRLQSWVRSWLPGCRAEHQRAVDIHRDAQARKIQCAFRHHLARRGLHDSRADRQLRSVSLRSEEVRNQAATRIQSFWRMYSTQQQLFDYFKFMLQDRHDYATTVQRRWRGHFTRAVLAPQLEERVREQEARVQARTVQHCAAVRIQSFYRMYMARRELRKRGVTLPHTELYRKASALRIQTRWRMHVAYHRVLQLRLQRSYELKQAQALEAQHAYATRIQAVARSFLVRRRYRAAEPPAFKSTAAAQPALAASPPADIGAPSPLSPSPITRLMVPRPPPIPRGSASRPSSAEAHGASLTTSAAPSLSPTTSGGAAASVPEAATRWSPTNVPSARASVPSLLSLNASGSPALLAVRSDCTSTSVSRLTSTTDRPLNLLHSNSTEPASVTGLPPASTPSPEPAQVRSLRSTSSSPPTAGPTATPQPAETRAATLIQAVWRGHHVRSSFEYYYEEYYEEVSVGSGEEVAEGGNGKGGR